MLKFALVLAAGFAGLALVGVDGTLNYLIEEKLIWAALLPGVYLIGMGLLRD